MKLYTRVKMNDELYRKLLYGEIGCVIDVDYGDDDEVIYPDEYRVVEDVSYFRCIIHGIEYRMTDDPIDIDVSENEELVLFRVRSGCCDVEHCYSGFVKKDGEWYFIDIEGESIYRLI